MPRGSNPGERRGGRAAGTPNKRTIDLRERIAQELGDSWDPVLAMAMLAESKDLPVDLRLRCLAEVAPYLHARRKPAASPEDAIGLEALVASAVTISVTTGVPAPDPRPAVNPDVALESPASLATPSPPPRPPRPPLRLSMHDAGGTAITDYEPFDN